MKQFLYLQRFIYLNYQVTIVKEKVMKKIFLMVFAAAGLMFASCGNKTNAEAEVTDSLATNLEMEADEAAADLISQLKEKLNLGDADGISALIGTAKAKIAELVGNNPEIAKQYLEKIQGFLKENADNIKNVIGDNAALATAIDGFANLPAEGVDKFLGLTDAVENAGKDVKEAAENAVDNAQKAVENKTNEAVSHAKEKAAEKINNAAEKTNEAVNEAAEKAAKKIGL